MQATQENEGTVSYKDILGHIGEQLKNRQSLIIKRVAYVSLPLILTVVSAIYFGQIAQDLNLSDEVTTIVVSVLIGLTVFITFPWAVIMGKIFSIERIIWIDSFFDQVTLTDKQSWQLAKRLFWPMVVVSVLIFFRYILWAVIASLALVFGYVALVIYKIIEFNAWVLLGVIIAVIVAYLAYRYFLAIWLRYLPFLLVDSYKTQTFSYSALFSETKRLNKATKTSDFKKLVVVTIGSDIAEVAISTAVGAGTAVAASNLNGTGKAAAQAAAMYANEVVATNKKFTQTVTYYVFYRLARTLLYGTSQTVNQELYGNTETTHS